MLIEKKKKRIFFDLNERRSWLGDKEGLRHAF